MAVCMGCRGLKLKRQLVCRRCWARLPGELRRAWFAAEQTGERTAKLVAARAIFAWMRGAAPGGATTGGGPIGVGAPGVGTLAATGPGEGPPPAA